MRTKLRSKVTLLFMMLGMLVAIPAIALADNIQDSIDTSQNKKSIATGTANTWTNNYFVQANGSGGPGCDIPTGGSATYKLNVPAGVTAVSPDGTNLDGSPKLVFTACGTATTNTRPVTFSSNTPGVYNISLTFLGGAGGVTDTFNESPAALELTVVAAPSVTAISPANNASGVAVTDNVSATFSQAMDASKFTTSTFKLVKDGTTTALNAGYTYDSTTNTATLNPSADLLPGTKYNVTVVSGANGVKTPEQTQSGVVVAGGYTLEQDKTWSFTTLNPNTPPVANNDNYNVNEDDTLDVLDPGVLGNDTDADNDTLFVASPRPVSGPTNGSLHLHPTGQFDYTPEPNFHGIDTFTYKAEDGTAESNVATVTITVASVNDRPTCQDVSIETDEDTQSSVAANCSDADGDTLTYAIEDEPANGNATVDGSTLKYDPELNFNGSDSFTYSASDGSASSDPADVDVTVNPVNDPPPTPGAISTTSALSSDGTFTLNWGASIDVDGDNVTYALEKRDADDANWSPVASGLSSSSYTFGGSNPAEDEGTWDYRVKAVDSPAGAESDFSTAENLVKVDKSAPSQPNATTNPANPVANSGGWFKDSVTVKYDGSTDPALLDTSDGSGVASYTADQVFSTSGTHDYSGKATDNVGNESAARTGQVKVDADNPTFGNCQGGPFLVNSGSGTPTTQSVSITASDGESGIDSANSELTKSVDTSSTGPKTVTFTAKDKVGHSDTMQCTYNVNTHTFIGFSSPVDNPSYLNVMKAGQAVPLKWQLKDASGNPVTNLQSVTVTVKDTNCQLGQTADQVEEFAAGSSSLQNLGGGYYQFNWKSPTSYAKSCKMLTVNGVGVQQSALFQFTK
jgi:hypothetical protein